MKFSKKFSLYSDEHSALRAERHADLNENFRVDNENKKNL